MTRLRSFLSRGFCRFITDDRGATAIEYTIMASGIALAIVTALALVGERVRALYDSIVAAFS